MRYRPFPGFLLHFFLGSWPLVRLMPPPSMGCGAYFEGRRGMASTQGSKTVPQNCSFQQSMSGTSDMVSNVGWEPVFSCDMSCHIILKQQKIYACSAQLHWGSRLWSTALELQDGGNLNHHQSRRYGLDWNCWRLPKLSLDSLIEMELKLSSWASQFLFLNIFLSCP